MRNGYIIPGTENCIDISEEGQKINYAQAECQLTSLEWERMIWALADEFGYTGTLSCSVGLMRYSEGGKSFHQYSAQFQELTPCAIVVMEQDWKESLESMRKQVSAYYKNKPQICTVCGQPIKNKQHGKI